MNIEITQINYGHWLKIYREHHKLGENNGVRQLNENGELVTDGRSIAELFSSFFVSQPQRLLASIKSTFHAKLSKDKVWNSTYFSRKGTSSAKFYASK
jgi:hypothetical protein